MTTDLGVDAALAAALLDAAERVAEFEALLARVTR